MDQLKQSKKKKVTIKSDLIGVYKNGGQPCTNIPHLLGISTYLTWGYQGWGPTELSMNTLYHFTDRDYEFARLYHNDFLEKFIAPLENSSNFRIPKEVILKWINKRTGPNGIPPEHVGGIWQNRTEREALEHCRHMKEGDPSNFLGPRGVVND